MDPFKNMKILHEQAIKKQAETDPVTAQAIETQAQFRAEAIEILKQAGLSFVVEGDCVVSIKRDSEISYAAGKWTIIIDGKDFSDVFNVFSLHGQPNEYPRINLTRVGGNGPRLNAPDTHEK